MNTKALNRKALADYAKLLEMLAGMSDELREKFGAVINWKEVRKQGNEILDELEKEL